MKLTEEQRKLFVEKLGYAILRQCSVCSSNEWSASDTIFELREFQEGSLVIGGSQGIYPVIPLTCNNCGNTLFINALKIGVLPPQKSEGKK